jgi:hypothetical protein
MSTERPPAAPDDRQAVSRVDSELKKPYTKPAFLVEQVFETMALSCGKVQSGGACAGNKKNS